MTSAPAGHEPASRSPEEAQFSVAWRLLAGDLAVPFYFALGRVLLQLAVNLWGGYGIFRDELYYLACAEHPAAGYVDQPPLALLVLAVNRFLLGDSVFALRFLPALASGATLFLVGSIVRAMGGGRSAQVFACTAWIVSPIQLGMFSIYQMNVFDLLLWALALRVFTELLRAPSPRLWLLLGLLLGLGLQNKVSVLWLCAGIAAGVVLSGDRRVLRTPWPYAAAGIAMLIFLPYVFWNLTHDLAHWEFIRNATAGKYAGLSSWTFLSGQALLQNPVTLPLWLAGLGVLLFGRSMRPYRPLAVVYAVALILLLVNGHSKAEYLSAAYPPLVAAGGVLAERLIVHAWRRALGIAYLALMAVAGVALTPFALPVLPVEAYIRYADALGVAPSSPESMRLEKLPQFYADMFGWEKKAADVAAVYHTLPPGERERCAIFANNYGRCAAIDFFGPRYGLPKSIGNHNTYWLWGPRDYTGELIIVLGGALKDKQEVFDSVEVAGVSTAEYCMPYENNLAIYVCRNLKVPLKEFWPRLKEYHLFDPGGKPPMVYDRIENARRYETLHELFAQAFAVLRRPDLADLPAGRHELHGDSIYLVIVRKEGTGREKAVLETHRRYIDIQFSIRGTDAIGWKPAGDCALVTQPYDASKDIAFYGDAPVAWTPVAPGMFTIFFPDDAHAPMVGDGILHKAVVKVAVHPPGR